MPLHLAGNSLVSLFSRPIDAHSIMSDYQDNFMYASDWGTGALTINQSPARMEYDSGGTPGSAGAKFGSFVKTKNGGIRFSFYFDDTASQFTIWGRVLNPAGPNWSGYVLKIVQGSNTSELVILGDSWGWNIVDSKNLGLAVDTWHTVEFLFVGDELQAKINGNVELEASDSTHVYGYIEVQITCDNANNNLYINDIDFLTSGFTYEEET